MRTITSPKHPNWTITKNGDTAFTMCHNDYKGYLIEVTQWQGEWYGEILTQQKIQDLPGEWDWMPAQSNPMFAPIATVKKEVERRGKYWKNRKAF